MWSEKPLQGSLNRPFSLCECTIFPPTSAWPSQPSFSCCPQGGRKWILLLTTGCSSSWVLSTAPKGAGGVQVLPGARGAEGSRAGARMGQPVLQAERVRVTPSQGRMDGAHIPDFGPPRRQECSKLSLFILIISRMSCWAGLQSTKEERANSMPHNTNGPSSTSFPLSWIKSMRSTGLGHFTKKTGPECPCSSGLAGNKGWGKAKQLRLR